MTLRERIQKLCKINTTSLNQVETELGFGKGYLSKLDSSTPNTKKMEQVANHFGVTIDFLMGKTDMVVCPVCGFGGNPLSEQSRKEHEWAHKYFLKIKKQFPQYMPYQQADKLRNESIATFRNPNSTLEKKKEAFKNYLNASFSLELSRTSYDEFEDVDYERYCQHEVGNICASGNIDYVLKTELISEYGISMDYVYSTDMVIERVRNNAQLIRILAYAERLTPEMLDAIEIQLKALAEQNAKE